MRSTRYPDWHRHDSEIQAATDAQLEAWLDQIGPYPEKPTAIACAVMMAKEIRFRRIHNRWTGKSSYGALPEPQPRHSMRMSMSFD